MHSVAGAQVTREVPSCTERLETPLDCAPMSSSSHVHSEVACEHVWLGEDTQAPWSGAFELLQCMHTSMPGQVARCGEALSAGFCRAMIKFLSRVGLPVAAEGVLVMEPVVAVELTARKASVTRLVVSLVASVGGVVVFYLGGGFWCHCVVHCNRLLDWKCQGEGNLESGERLHCAAPHAPLEG